MEPELRRRRLTLQVSSSINRLTVKERRRDDEEKEETQTEGPCLSSLSPL
jgi:hypothetical protein